MSEEHLWSHLQHRTTPEQQAWLSEAVNAVMAEPGAIRARFPVVGRRLGRGTLDPSADAGDLFAWTIDDAGRALLLVALADRAGAGCGGQRPPCLVEQLGDLYRHGDAAERRGVLRALPLLALGDRAIPLVADAIRTNDVRLIAAALGPYALAHLDDDALAQAVLKCVFVGIPVDRIDGLEARATPRMARMLAGYVHERVAAGRDVPPAVWPLIDAHPPEAELAAIAAERDHPDPQRRRAATTALAGRAGTDPRTCSCASSTLTSI